VACDWATLGVGLLGEGIVTLEAARRRSSTASTTPTTPTTSAVAVAVAATATRVVPTSVTVPTPPNRIRASDA
jgi:hypothetical protein